MVANSKTHKKTSQFCGAYPSTRNGVCAVHRNQAGSLTFTRGIVLAPRRSFLVLVLKNLILPVPKAEMQTLP